MLFKNARGNQIRNNIQFHHQFGSSPVPEIITSTLPTYWEYNETCGPSEAQSFTVSGNNLVGPVTIDDDNAKLEFSTIGASGPYATDLSLSQTGGDLDGEPVTVWVRAVSGQTEGPYSTEIRLNSTGATEVATSGAIVQIFNTQITPSTTSLSGFSYTEGSGPSSEQSFTIDSSQLLEDYVVTAPTNYEISETSGSGFTSSIVVTEVGGTTSPNPKTIYVRLKSGLSASTYNEVIQITQTCETTNVNVNGSVAAVPDVITSVSSLSGFTYAEGSGPSAEQTFTVSGDNLTAQAVVTAPTNYEISETSGSGFGTTINLSQTGGDLDGEPVVIYVRLKSGLTQSTYNETLTVTSTGATTENVTLNGTVSSASATLTKGNVTADDTAAIGSSPNTATITTHTQNSGSDRLLVVNVFYINTKNCTGVTWNGTALTKLYSQDYTDTGAALTQDVWYLIAPDTGNHDLVYTFDSGGGNCTSLLTSFTGADQTTPLNYLHTDAANSPHSQSITISADSMIMAIGCSRWSYSTVQAITIDGTKYGFGSCDIDTAISSAQVCVETRNARLTSGSKTVILETVTPTYKTSNTRVEIVQA
jgi:hypothetical protein